MSKGFTTTLIWLGLLLGGTLALGSCTTARAQLTPAERVAAPDDEFPAASPAFLPPARPPEIQAP
jgi:hypothetical protein